MKQNTSGRIDCSFYNEYGHLVELNVFYLTCILVNARICNDELELVGIGKNNHSRKIAIREAIQSLYQQAYGLEKRSLKTIV